MKTRLMLVLPIGLLIAADAPKDDAKDVTKAIEALNTAFTKQDAETVKRLMAPDHIAITPYYRGAVTRDEELKTMPDLKVLGYKASHLKVHGVSKDVVMVTYSLELKGTFKGKPLAVKNFVSATWVKRDGNWLEMAYQETPLDDK